MVDDATTLTQLPLSLLWHHLVALISASEVEVADSLIGMERSRDREYLLKTVTNRGMKALILDSILLTTVQNHECAWNATRTYFQRSELRASQRTRISRPRRVNKTVQQDTTRPDQLQRKAHEHYSAALK